HVYTTQVNVFWLGQSLSQAAFVPAMNMLTQLSIFFTVDIVSCAVLEMRGYEIARHWRNTWCRWRVWLLFTYTYIASRAFLAGELNVFCVSPDPAVFDTFCAHLCLQRHITARSCSTQVIINHGQV